MAEICGAVYERLIPDANQPVYILCTYVSPHTARHSWETLRAVDEAEAQARHADITEAIETGSLPLHVRKVVLALGSGELDEYIELILAAGHDRKRAKRGTLGFPRRAR